MNPDDQTTKIKILLAEDDDLIRNLLKTKLEKNSFEVIEAIDGTTVPELARQHRPGIIALDILMPLMNGYQVLDLLKQDAELNQIPVVVISNLGQDDEIEKCRQKGAVDFLIKANLTPSQMVNKLREAYWQANK